MDIEVGDYVRTNDGLIFKIFTKTKTTYGFCGLTDSSNKKIFNLYIWKRELY